MVKWNIRLDKDDVDLTWVYDNLFPTCMTLKFHHSGRFTGFPGRKYLNEIIDYVDKVDYEKLSVFVLDEMVKKIVSPPKGLKVFYHFLIPGQNLDYGLRSLSSYQDIQHMLTYVPAVRNVDLYIELDRARVPTYMIASPGQCKVVINEIIEDVPPIVNRRRAGCQKKLFLEWHQEGETSSEIPNPGHEVTQESENENVIQVEDTFEGECVTQVAVEESNIGSNVTGKVGGDGVKGKEKLSDDASKSKEKIVEDGPVDLFDLCGGFNPFEEFVVVETDVTEVREEAVVVETNVTEVMEEPVVVETIVTEVREKPMVLETNVTEVREEPVVVETNVQQNEHLETDMGENCGEVDADEDHNDESGGSDDSDSDFDLDEVDRVPDIAVDMQDYNENVDMNEEWMGSTTTGPEVTDEVPNVEDDVDPVEHEEFESAEEDGPDSEWKENLRKARREHERNVGNEGRSNFYLGQLFGAKSEIKILLKRHAVESKRDLVIIKNDSFRLRAVCRGELKKAAPQGDGPADLSGPSGLSGPNECSGPKLPGGQNSGRKSKWGKAAGESCPWVLLVSKTTKNVDDNTWIVKTYISEHKCMESRDIGLATATFLAEKVQEHLGFNPTIPTTSLKAHLQNSLAIGVSIQKTARARSMAMKKIWGDYTEQYARLRDYICELQRCNPETTVKLDVYDDPNPDPTTRKFKRLYVCLGPLKKGFKAGKSELLGLDGTFMKGAFPGQLLTAVGIDPNGGTYPIAYGVVESKNFASWSWFLQYLGEDLDISEMSNFTFISDRQKGILPAIAKLFPCAEHRYCLRHVHENMKLHWKGKAYKDLLWKCATATTVPEFNTAMEEMKEFNESCYEWLKQIPAHHWTRSHFTGRAHSDVLLNNICEVFNKQLREGRDKPIISALEYIRTYLMRRIVNVQKVIDSSDGPLTPTATKLLDKIKEEANSYIVSWNGGIKYEVTGPWNDQCIVDVRANTCSCRKWELTGMPCKHVVATVWHMNSTRQHTITPESLMNPVYYLSTWKEMYQFKLEPLNGRNMWPKSNCPTTLLPPKHHKPIGRPSKKRRKSADEAAETSGRPGKIPRKGKSLHCSKCKKAGHNARTCKKK